jgi:hypothetical protein
MSCRDCGQERHIVIEAVRCSIRCRGRDYARRELLTTGLSLAKVEDLLFTASPFTESDTFHSGEPR